MAATDPIPSDELAVPRTPMAARLAPKEEGTPGRRLVLVGKHKTSLSWLGVPMRGASVDGIISIGSYRPNAFDRGDLELLNTLAQHAAQALDKRLGGQKWRDYPNLMRPFHRAYSGICLGHKAELVNRGENCLTGLFVNQLGFIEYPRNSSDTHSRSFCHIINGWLVFRHGDPCYERAFIKTLSYHLYNLS